MHIQSALQWVIKVQLCVEAQTGNDSRHRLKTLKESLHETSQGQSVMSDLNRYLEESVFPRKFDFNLNKHIKLMKGLHAEVTNLVHDGS